jgi:hypothetical protein
MGVFPLGLSIRVVLMAMPAYNSEAPFSPVEIFYSYSHKDEVLRDELEKHLSILKRQGVISGWHDRRIAAGSEWAGEIDEHLESAKSFCC